MATIYTDLECTTDMDDLECTTDKNHQDIPIIDANDSISGNVITFHHDCASHTATQDEIVSIPSHNSFHPSSYTDEEVAIDDDESFLNQIDTYITDIERIFESTPFTLVTMVPSTPNNNDEKFHDMIDSLIQETSTEMASAPLFTMSPILNNNYDGVSDNDNNTEQMLIPSINDNAMYKYIDNIIDDTKQLRLTIMGKR